MRLRNLLYGKLLKIVKENKNINIIWIDGGLGNQMFQYALVLKIQNLGIYI